MIVGLAKPSKPTLLPRPPDPCAKLKCFSSFPVPNSIGLDIWKADWTTELPDAASCSYVQGVIFQCGFIRSGETDSRGCRREEANLLCPIHESSSIDDMPEVKENADEDLEDRERDEALDRRRPRAAAPDESRSRS